MKELLNFGENTRGGFSNIDQNTIAVVPIGAIEQHGPHLPVNTDSLIIEYILKNAVPKSKYRVVVAPLLQYGYSPHHYCYPGVISLQSETVLALLKDIGLSLIRCGFTKILFISGHGGNMHLIGQAARDLGSLHPNVIAASASYWDIALNNLLERMRGLTEWIPGHAGLFETSLIMAIRGDLVDTDEADKLQVDPQHVSEVLFTGLNPRVYFERYAYHLSIHGVTDSVSGASKELGMSILEIINHDLVEFLDSFSAYV